MKKMKWRIWSVRKLHSLSHNPEFNLPEGLEELSSEQTKNIIGGDGIGYWLGYVGGKIAQLFS